MKKSSILKEKAALGGSDSKQLNAHLILRKGAGFCHATEKAPDVPGHMPSTLLPVGGEAGTAPRNEFTERHQPLQSICARTQQKLLQLPRLNSAMPHRGKERVGALPNAAPHASTTSLSNQAQPCRTEMFSFPAATGTDCRQTQHLDRCSGPACCP